MPIVFQASHKRLLLLAAVGAALVAVTLPQAASAAGPFKYCDQVLISAHGQCTHGARHFVTRLQAWSTGTAIACAQLKLAFNNQYVTYACAASAGGTSDSGFFSATDGWPAMYNNSTFQSRFSGNFYTI